MTVYEATNNFIAHMEKVQRELDLSNREFAKLMHMSESGYYKIISGERRTISLSLIMAMYDLTGEYMFEFVDCKPPREYEALGKYKQLKERDRLIIDMLLDALLKSDREEELNEVQEM